MNLTNKYGLVKIRECTKIWLKLADKSGMYAATCGYLVNYHRDYTCCDMVNGDYEAYKEFVEFDKRYSKLFPHMIGYSLVSMRQCYETMVKGYDVSDD